jgi:hypothetical protein
VLLLTCCVCSWLCLFWITNLFLDDSKLIWIVVLLQKTLILGSTPSSERIHSGTWRITMVMTMAMDSVATKRDCACSPFSWRQGADSGTISSHIAAIFCYKLSATCSPWIFFICLCTMPYLHDPT